MGKQETVIAEGESIKEFFEVRHADAVHLLELAQSEEQLAEAKALDDLVFGSHQGITMDELIEIMNHGAVILLRDQAESLVGQSQIITSSIPQYPNLAADEAYNYGTAIHPDFQNQGIAQLLYKGQEKVALEFGKTRSTLSVRLENGQSVRGRLKAGYGVTGYNPNYYGPVEAGGARLIMEKDHTYGTEVVSPDILANLLAEGRVLVVDESNIERAIQEDQTIMGVPITVGDEIDFGAHKLVSKIFSTDKFIGVGLLKPNEFNLNGTQSLLLLKQK